MIYLDNAATTQPYQEVIDVMVDVMQNHWGNPSSSYAFGDDSRRIIESVRSQIAEDINCSPDEIIFTSGSCEANSLAIDGFLKAHEDAICLTTKIEHASINETNAHHFLDNDQYGFIRMGQIGIVNSNPGLKGHLVSIAAANGEIGTIQDIKSISKDVHNLGGIFHTDATQLYPERRIDVQELNIDMMSVSAQKFNGPRGVGFLYVKKGIQLKPIIYGSQENNLRGGTYNTAAIAGMGEALKWTRHFQRLNAVSLIEELRNRLLDKLMQIQGITLNGPPVGSNRLANNINLTIDGVNAEKLVTLCSLNGIYIAKGSACQSYNPNPSSVLTAIGLTDEQAFNTIRITVSLENTEEIDEAADIITKLIERIRNEEK
ncbi:MAG: cysteine desulfurase family protein [Candidatus Kurthia intestinigallinarum]